MSKIEFLKQDIDIVESLPSLCPAMQEFEEQAVINVDKVIEKLTEKSYGIQLDGALVASDKTIVELKDAVKVVKAGGIE